MSAIGCSLVFSISINSTGPEHLPTPTPHLRNSRGSAHTTSSHIHASISTAPGARFQRHDYSSLIPRAAVHARPQPSNSSRCPRTLAAAQVHPSHTQSCASYIARAERRTHTKPTRSTDSRAPAPIALITILQMPRRPERPMHAFLSFHEQQCSRVHHCNTIRCRFSGKCTRLYQFAPGSPAASPRQGRTGSMMFSSHMKQYVRDSLKPLDELSSKIPQRCLKDTAHKCQLIQHRSTVCKASPHGQHQSTSFSTGSISAFSVQDPSIRAVGSRRSRASNICTGLSHQHRQTCVNIHLLLDFVLRPRHQHGTRCAALALMYFLRGELVIRCVAALPIYAGVSDVPLRHLSWNEPRGGLVQPPSQTTSTPPHDQPPHPRPRVRQSHFILRLHVPALGRSQLQPERQPWGLVQTRGLHSFTSELNFSSSMTRS